MKKKIGLVLSFLCLTTQSALADACKLRIEENFESNTPITDWHKREKAVQEKIMDVLESQDFVYVPNKIKEKVVNGKSQADQVEIEKENHDYDYKAVISRTLTAHPITVKSDRFEPQYTNFTPKEATTLRSEIRIVDFNDQTVDHYGKLLKDTAAFSITGEDADEMTSNVLSQSNEAIIKFLKKSVPLCDDLRFRRM